MALWGWGDLDEDEKYLYHYTGPETLARILHNHSLRMGPYSGTRDPRENAPWFPNLVGGPGVDGDQVDAMAIWQRLDLALRQRAHLACLTMDRQPTDPVHTASARGWGRPRMWEQYAARHQGAVLVFDVDRLAGAVQHACGDTVLLAGEVSYVNGPWNLSVIEGVPIADVLSKGEEAVADELIKEKGRSFFFTKDGDWVSETEYRFVTIGEGPVFIDIQGALIGLALGTDYPDYEVAVLKHRLELAGCPDVSLTRVRWQNGYPLCVPEFG